MAYPAELRRQVISLVLQGQTRKTVAADYGLNYHTVRNWCRLAEQGQFAPQAPGPKKWQPRNILVRV